VTDGLSNFYRWNFNGFDRCFN